MSDDAQAIGERIRLLANNVPTATLQTVAGWLGDITAEATQLLGANHPELNGIAQAIGEQVAAVDSLTGQFNQLKTELERIGDRIAGH